MKIKALWVSTALLIIATGCERPHKDSYRGRREASFSQAWGHIMDRENPEEAAMAARKVGRILAGDPAEAERTSRRVFEID